MLPRTFKQIVGTALAVLSVAAILTTVDQASAQTPRVPASKLGMYVGFDSKSRFDEFESALGLPLRYIVTMADSTSPSAMRSSVWGQFANSSAYLPKVSNRVDVVLSVPLAFGPGGMGMTSSGQATIRNNLQATANGALDGDFRAVARYLKDAGYGDAIIRLGHEFDGDWAPYSARNNNAGYIAAFRHVHDVFKSESSAFRFEWTAMDAHFIDYGPPAYPGDSYVDIIGLDFYWREQQPISDNQWKYQMHNVLVAHQAFATAHGKPVSYPEWGRALADHSRFIDLMYGWFSSLPTSGPGGLLYHAYFNEYHMKMYNLNDLPNVKRRYLELFGAGNAPAEAPLTTGPVLAPAERLDNAAPVVGSSGPETTAPATTAPATTAPATTAPATTAPPTTAPATTAPATTVPATTAPATTAPAGLAPTATKSGTSTQASIEASVVGDRLTAWWRHPTALNYIMRYRAADSPWWIWLDQGLNSKAEIGGVNSAKEYIVEVITNVGGRWQEWNRLVVGPQAQTAPPTTAPTTTVVTTPPAPPAPSPLTERAFSSKGDATKADISATVSDDGTLQVKWSHPRALNYILRHRATGSKWWTWEPQGMKSEITIDDIDLDKGYSLEVITNVGGQWQQWHALEVTP